MSFDLRQLQARERISGKDKEKISYLHVITLMFVRDKKPLMSEIADYLDITPPSATSLIDKLIGNKMAERISDSNDRRTVKIVITKKGKMYIAKSWRIISSKMRKSLEDLSVREQDELIRILTKVIDSYKK